MRKLRTKRSYLVMPSLLAFIIILFIVTPIFSQDGWTKLQVGDEGVFIFRDEFGVPHVLADSAGALFEAFGYVAAQDRLTQLEISRRQARGRLAEVLGPGVLASDVEARREGYTEEELKGQYSVLRAETRVLVEAYARGINRWIDEVKADRDKKLPKELWELGIQNPEPWSICDSLAVGIAAGRRFGQRGGSELENLKELEKLGRDEFDKKYPLNDPSAPTTISFNDKNLNHTPEFFLAAGHPPEADNESLQLTTLPGLPAKLGSYAVAVSSGRSSSGCAMLLGCPQMGFEGPQPGYEVDLHGGGFDVAGMTFPGVPAVLIGYNNYVAWTVTSGCSDNMDVFIEELNPTDTKKYKFKGEWQEFESRQEIFSVRGAAEDVRENICRSVHGTVFRVDKQENRAFSKKRTFWGEDAKTFESFIDIDRADSIGDFTEAAGTIALSFNLFCTASDGQIGYWHTGRYRVPAPGVDPRLPAKGTGVDEWMGFVPREKLPHSVNPPEGLIVNWNNKPSKDWDNGDNTPWVGGHRVSYILGLVAGKKKITFDDLKAVPRGIESHGTYQQAVELAENGPTVLSILPPGENGFLDKRGVSNPHSSDQSEMFDAWQYKPAHFLNGDADNDGIYDRKEAERGTNPFVMGQ